MKQINEMLQFPPVTVKKPTSERGELVGFFQERLRDKSGKKYRPARIGFVTAHLSLSELYYLKSLCEQAKDFGRCFWGSLKVKKENVD